MNTQYINPLAEAISTVLSTMAMVDAKPGKPSLKTNNIALGDITGMIDLSGTETNGSLAISFSTPAILDITEKMLGEKFDSIDETVIDLVGEITNMITGSAKRIYSEQGLEFDLTHPTTKTGSDHIIEHNIEAPTIVVPFATDAGKFYMEVCFA